MKNKGDITLGIQCCLGIDSRKCAACPYHRTNGRINPDCLEKLLKADLEDRQKEIKEEDDRK